MWRVAVGATLAAVQNHQQVWGWSELRGRLGLEIEAGTSMCYLSPRRELWSLLRPEPA